MKLKVFICVLGFLSLFSCKKDTLDAMPTTTTTGKFTLKSPAFTDNGTFPKEHTCDGASTSPPLSWENLPTGTKSIAITMHHIPPEGGKHVYMVLYNISTTLMSIPVAVTGVGKWGINTVNGKNVYTPPCSQGPGPKIYVLTAYALSAEPLITTTASATTMDVLLEAIKNTTLSTSTLTVTYSRP